MRHFKDVTGKLYGFDATQAIPEGLVEITIDEAQRLGAVYSTNQYEQELAAQGYVAQRLAHYPNVGEYLDAIVSGDPARVQAYIDECKRIKALYPKVE